MSAVQAATQSFTKVSIAKLPGDTVFRAVKLVAAGQKTSDGAGVNLKRVIGSSKIPDLDPFLLLDEFKSSDPKDYEAGFPEHSHRGFETVTIMLHGNFKHQDSKGNTGYMTSGSVQWLTAGRGIMHTETPMQSEGLLWGFQLWVNLPAKDKMKEPRYQDIPPEKIPNVELDNGTKLRLIAGKVGDVEGAVTGIHIQPTLLDVTIPSGQVFEHEIPDGHTLFAYTLEGEGQYEGKQVEPGKIVIFEPEGNAFRVTAGSEPHRFLVVSGAPIKEPVARYGPFVMNTREEIMQTLMDFRSGNF